MARDHAGRQAPWLCLCHALTHWQRARFARTAHDTSGKGTAGHRALHICGCVQLAKQER